VNGYLDKIELPDVGDFEKSCWLTCATSKDLLTTIRDEGPVRRD
jgi:hypothetical protein